MPGASEDDDFLPISGLQHLAFCERQCALIHVERVWQENARTAEGQAIHERVNLPGSLDGGRIVRAMHLRSERLKLRGQADAVEFRAGPDGKQVSYPVEYKRGKAGHRFADSIQLCAQAMALEEMTGVPVPAGALYYFSSRKRVEIRIDDGLREKTSRLAVRFHEMMRTREVPKAWRDSRCTHCSLLSICQPQERMGVEASGYLSSVLESFMKADRR